MWRAVARCSSKGACAVPARLLHCSPRLGCPSSASSTTVDTAAIGVVSDKTPIGSSSTSCALLTNHNEAVTRSEYTNARTPAITTVLPMQPSPELVVAASSVLAYPFQMIDAIEALERVAKVLVGADHVSVDLEACVVHDPLSHRLGDLSLIQLCSSNSQTIFLIDVLTLGKDRVVAALRPCFESTTVEKLFFDCRRDVEALSTQLGLIPKQVLDLQLMYAGIQWKFKSIHRRFNLGTVMKAVTNEARQDSDAAVRLAMTKGNRPVWDVRPLPQHFLEYAAGDVKNTMMLGTVLLKAFPDYVDGARRLSQQYVELYGASGKPVEIEVDPTPAEVSIPWLERFFGPGGVCGFCKQRGHSEAECFRKAKGATKCSHCGDSGHVAKNCFKRFPHLLKCEKCGQVGHRGDRCFRSNPCKHCGGAHDSANCHRKRK